MNTTETTAVEKGYCLGCHTYVTFDVTYHTDGQETVVCRKGGCTGHGPSARDDEHPNETGWTGR